MNLLRKLSKKYMKNNSLKYTLFTLLLCFFVSCGYQDAPEIGNSMSFPGSIVALNSNQFVLLNTDANGDYKDGSIQLYDVDSSENHHLNNSFSVAPHGSELAVTQDSKYVALSYDSSVNPSIINFFDYSNPSSPKKINLTLNLANAGGQQAVKRIGFFKRNSDATHYYFYGVIYTYPNNDGSFANIPPRAFLARINSNFTSADMLFYLSYGVNDPNSLAKKSTTTSMSYSFGFSAPTYDADHDLFIAFPTGSLVGDDASSSYPPIPANPYMYYEGQFDPAYGCDTTLATCTTLLTQDASDMRVVSLAAVDLSNLSSLGGSYSLNNATYFVPLAWNANGLPWGATTKTYTVNYQNYTPNAGVSDLNSFAFQFDFWSAQWTNYTNAGSNPTASCYTTSTPTAASSQYNLHDLGSNALLVSKSGVNGGADATGLGNEIFQIAGLDKLKLSIITINTARANVPAGESDFNVIAKNQVLDVYNTSYPVFSSAVWLNPIPYNSGTLVSGDKVLPLVPYMFSRTTGVSGFDGTSTAPINIGVLNFGSGTCTPYWTRDTITGFSNFVQDTAWIGASPVSLTAGSNPTFADGVIDPTAPFNYPFGSSSGAITCTDVSPQTGTPVVFCVNFMYGDITHFRASSSGTVFRKY